MGFKPRFSSSEIIAAVRKRPGMYVGDTNNGGGLHQLVWELVANGLDEHLAGHGSQIDLTIYSDGSFSVSDLGRGISVDVANNKDNEQSYLESVLLDLHTTASQDGHAPHVHVGQKGVGLMPINALSESFEVDTHHGGGHWRVSFARGVQTEPLRRLGNSKRTGTTIRAKADPTIFSMVDLSYERIRDRLTELARLSKTLRFRLRDERTHDQTISVPSGISSLVSRDARDNSVHGHAALSQPILVEAQTPVCFLEAAIMWRTDGMKIESFANLERTREGGSHVDGLLDGIKDGYRLVEEQSHRQPTSGLHAAIHVKMTKGPSYYGPTKERLAEPGLRGHVRSAVRRAIVEHFEAHPNELASLLKR